MKCAVLLAALALAPVAASANPLSDAVRDYVRPMHAEGRTTTADAIFHCFAIADEAVSLAGLGRNPAPFPLERHLITSPHAEFQRLHRQFVRAAWAIRGDHSYDIGLVYSLVQIGCVDGFK